MGIAISLGNQNGDCYFPWESKWGLLFPLGIKMGIAISLGNQNGDC